MEWEILPESPFHFAPAKIRHSVTPLPHKWNGAGDSERHGEKVSHVGLNFV